MLVRMSDAPVHRVVRAAGAALVAALMGLGTGAIAQTASAVNPATYMGVDREKVLVEGAKREGALSIYASMPVEDMTALTTAFEKKYGIKPTTWRGGSEELRQRVTTEARAGRFTVDIIDTNGVELEAPQREKLLQPVDCRRTGWVHRVGGGSQALARLVYVADRPWVVRQPPAHVRLTGD